LDLRVFDVSEIDELLAMRMVGPDPDSVPQFLEDPSVRQATYGIMVITDFCAPDSISRIELRASSGRGLGGLVFTDPPYNVNYRQPPGFV